MKKTRWTRADQLAAAGVIVAAVAIIAAFVIPEGRRLVGLDNSVLQTAQTESRSQSEQLAADVAPKNHLPQPTTPKKPVRKATGRLKENSKVADNAVAGNNNVVGNGNQTGPTAIAPNGIAITGGNVSNPTVNNYGTPSLPTPTVKICVSQSKQSPDSVLFETKITLRTDVQITRPWFFFFFDGSVENGTAVMEHGIFGCNCPVRAEKLPNPERSFGFRTNSINAGTNVWYPNDEPIVVRVPSKTPVNLVKVLSGSGDNPDISSPENLVFTCD